MPPPTPTVSSTVSPPTVPPRTSPQSSLTGAKKKTLKDPPTDWVKNFKKSLCREPSQVVDAGPKRQGNTRRKRAKKTLYTPRKKVRVSTSQKTFDGDNSHDDIDSPHEFDSKSKPSTSTGNRSKDLRDSVGQAEQIGGNRSKSLTGSGEQANQSGGNHFTNMTDSGNQDDLQSPCDDSESNFDLVDEEKYLDTSKPRRKHATMDQQSDDLETGYKTPSKTPYRSFKRSREYSAMRRDEMSGREALRQYKAKGSVRAGRRRYGVHAPVFGPVPEEDEEITVEYQGHGYEWQAEEKTNQKKRTKHQHQTEFWGPPLRPDPHTKPNEETCNHQTAHFTAARADHSLIFDATLKLEQQNARFNRLFEEAVENIVRHEDELVTEREATYQLFNPQSAATDRASQSTPNVYTGVNEDAALGTRPTSRSLSTIPNPIKKKKPSLLEPHSIIVWVVIKNTTFAVYRDFLDFYCPTLVPAGKGTSRVLPHKPDQAQDIDIKVFSLFIQWLYFQVVTRKNGEPSFQQRLMQLWILGSRLNMPHLQNNAIDGIERRRDTGQEIQIKTLVWIYANTSKEASLRRYLVDMCGPTINTLKPKVVQKYFPSEMLIEIMEADDGEDGLVDMGKYHVANG